jgi:hypothetical protein
MKKRENFDAKLIQLCNVKTINKVTRRIRIGLLIIYLLLVLAISNIFSFYNLIYVHIYLCHIRKYKFFCQTDFVLLKNKLQQKPRKKYVSDTIVDELL